MTHSADTLVLDLGKSHVDIESAELVISARRPWAFRYFPKLVLLCVILVWYWLSLSSLLAFGIFRWANNTMYNTIADILVPQTRTTRYTDTSLCVYPNPMSDPDEFELKCRYDAHDGDDDTLSELTQNSDSLQTQHNFESSVGLRKRKSVSRSSIAEMQ
eukprot:CAMPEP_0182442030 /NCGR_PEP_ID=MMETSP1172-20130603/1014_1 /TAXON_ID=708627 /ORGANISM="Timspurckia oligopyrenoides, Strain CCMP3278" /LENGTH=158 /DNA_ID=CAMNT_0024636707 /DNA_START=635 /DNA_END=1111 /DNA_ORIENTATION=+